MFEILQNLSKESRYSASKETKMQNSSVSSLQ